MLDNTLRLVFLGLSGINSKNHLSDTDIKTKGLCWTGVTVFGKTSETTEIPISDSVLQKYHELIN